MTRLIVLVACVVVASAPASADPGDPVTLAESAQASYASGDFAAAAAGFQRAFELDPKAEYLFGWAQAVRKGGDCATALVLYRRLLEMPLEEDQRAATQLAMARCKEEPPPVKQPPPITQQPQPPPPVLRPEPAPWYRDRRGLAWLGGAAVGVGAGAALTIASISDERAARRATIYDDHERLAQRARIFRATGIASLATGAIAGGIAIYHYRSRARVTATAWVTRGGGGLVLGGSLP